MGFVAAVALLFGILSPPVPVDGSFVAQSIWGRQTMVSLHPVVISMGLYDEPLPDRPDKANKGGPFNRINKNDPKLEPERSTSDDLYDDEEEDDYLTADDIFRLFSFDDRGVETNDLLPSLGRRLDTGIDCYFEPTDRKVVNLVEKTGCHPLDAAWALEAHRGDVTEAWMAISVVRRTALNGEAALPEMEEVQGTDWDSELKALLRSNGEEDEEVIRPLGTDGDGLADRRDDLRRKRQMDDLKDGVMDFTDSTEWGPNDQYLPGKDNPKPVDDEPWFTG